MNPRRNAFKITLIYFIVSLIWIISSDQILGLMVSDYHLSVILASLKGTFFIIMTSLLIYFLIYQNLDSIKESEERFYQAFNTNPIAIVLTEKDGEIIDANQSYLHLTGFEKEELLGRTPTQLHITTPQIQENIAQEFKDKGEIKDLEVEIVIKSGKKRTVLVSIESMSLEGKTRNINYLYDISQRKKYEKKLKNSLKEKEALLREVHHRVKNNLQIISSLLNLQSQFVEEDSKDILMVSQSRIRSMAMIHEKMYKSTDLTHIFIKNYIENFVSDLFYLYGIDQRDIHLHIDIEDIKLGIDTAIPLGLIINELVINIIKHAFPQKKGNIQISFKSLNGGYVLKVSDDGRGLPKDIKIDETETLGLQLVNNLVNQLEGNIEISQVQGTEFTITFNELIYEKRV